MASPRNWVSVGLVLLSAVALGQEALDLPARVRNWRAPNVWDPGAARDRRESAEPADPQTLASVSTSPMPFIGVTPCRIVDTRSAAFPSGYGPPSMAAGVSRDFTLTGRCGIPDTAQAVSLNVTVVSPQGLGYILIYPQGGNAPGVSTLNYLAGQTVANAAIAPLGTGGGVSVVAVVSGTQLLIDTNGYYGPAGVGSMNTFVGFNAGNFTMTGIDNTGIGASALSQSSSGSYNTASGALALEENDSGSWNTAMGGSALRFNVSGGYNTAAGYLALASNDTGSLNVAVGMDALASNRGGIGNTATGYGALSFSQSGDESTALGFQALRETTVGQNTAVGSYALGKDTTGTENTATGLYALYSNTTGRDNTANGFRALALGNGDNNTGIGAYALNHSAGISNTAVGARALTSNVDGSDNTASGRGALRSNVSGKLNTATGVSALDQNVDGTNNTADGASSLSSNVSGSYNTADGASSLASNVSGNYNTAVGDSALLNLDGGDHNVAIGDGAGSTLHQGTSNIYIGNPGGQTESHVIRIGDPTASRTFISGIYNVGSVGNQVPVLIDSNDQLVTQQSSARFKEGIEDMADASSPLRMLRPVTFRYKGQTSTRTQFGLIAEEVEKILPDLVVHAGGGEAQTVLYHELPAMLVNELQKLSRRSEQQDAEIAALRARLAALEATASRRAEE